ncbi:hypothetical protein [Haloarcula marismortui]|uniref:Uncharacterized protein n=1 Tax=Haloarcula marismortui ATCC 33799 TaxID=662475 RepID=M0KX34_9EURY|nr:hypothetical protein [Haloarcula californiae]EMA25423.1 hypothetical protein C435_02482 [Haloarcula californiae ATCC 33799]
MANIRITGLSDHEKELFEQAADDAGMKLAEYCRTRLRAGYRLWTAGGDFDVVEMRGRLDDDFDQTAANPSPAESATAAEQDRFKQVIKRNLPSDQEHAVSKADLDEIVRDDVLGEALQELIDEGAVEYNAMSEGYVRTEGATPE